ncbi:hypothetical protein [Roseivivax sediminis]|uniref:Sulfotransferase family protein n=1 Tax=Roseivivax sediminis TaxID=936889 RepID=A0A1I1UL05_9RHOB|nr:hypothetical protein [Roseivivax sediminis]SFD68640.1 hypothetical protein SAMN04515678_102284 [Roseivivax sediminis]
MRREIFTPIGETAPIFYLHIPKTSGSAQNTAISAIWQDSAIIHAESWFNAIRDRVAPPMRADAVSGHIAYASWRFTGLSDLYPAATVLRDPWTRLVSHINWMDRFNLGIDAGTQARLAPSHTRIVTALESTDFDDRDSLAALVAKLTEAGDDGLFDNLQVRMVTPQDAPKGRPVGEADLDRARAALRDFAIVGLSDDQVAFRHALEAHARRRGAAAASEGKVNTARSQRLSAGNAVAREVLTPWWQHDAQLVASVRKLPNRARRDRGLARMRRILAPIGGAGLSRHAPTQPS